MDLIQNKTKAVELYFLWELSKALNANFTPQEMVSSLSVVFQMFMSLDNFSIFVFDEHTNSLKEFNKNWSIIGDNKQKVYFEEIYNSFSSKSEQCFILNDKLIILDYNQDKAIKEIQKTLKNSNNFIFLPVIKNKSAIGLIKLEFSHIKEDFLTFDFFLSLSIAAAQISTSIINVKLNEQMIMNVNFHQAMKDIAKIIESQYELTYIVPLIGEMIDKFISEHLIYIYIKDDNQDYKLLWPVSYSGINYSEKLEQVNDGQCYISDNRTVGVFPLMSDNTVTGAILADGMINKLTEVEINYMDQLSKQASITIDKASTYAEILQHASMDALTGLNNRRQFEIRLKEEVSEAKRQSNPLCCMMLDVDFFKNINDNYGHAVGDFVLQEFARFIKEEVREYDFASRYGGEEFCVLLPSTTTEEAYLVAERLREKVAGSKFDLTEFELEKVRHISVTVSIGISSLDFECNDPSCLYKNADSALYKAKKSGRNKVIIF